MEAKNRDTNGSSTKKNSYLRGGQPYKRLNHMRFDYYDFRYTYLTRRNIIVGLGALLVAAALAWFVVWLLTHPTKEYLRLLEGDAATAGLANHAPADSLVKSINPDDLRRSELNLYNLIGQEVKFMSGGNPTNDSLMLVAADYFRSREDRVRQMRAIRMAALAQLDQRLLPTALYTALEGLNVAETVSDTLFMARFYTIIADCYKNAFNFDEEISRRTRAAELFKKIEGKDEHAFCEYLDLGTAFSNNQDFAEALNLLDSLEQKAIISYPDKLITIKQSSLMPCLFCDSITKAKNIISYLEEKAYPFTTYEYSVASQIYMKDNNLSKSKQYLDKAFANIKDEYDQIAYYDALIAYERASGNKIGTSEAYKSQNDVLEKSVKNIMSPKLLSTERDFYINKSIEDAIAKEQLKFIGAILIISAILLITVLLIIFYYSNKRKNERLSNYLIDIENAAEEASEKEHRIEELKNELSDKSHQLNQITEKSINTFKENFLRLKQLSIAYSENYGNSKTQITIIKEVDSIFKSLSSNNTKIKLEENLNLFGNQIITKIRSQIPNLNTREVDLLIYYIAGVPPRVISSTLNISMPYYYILKSRIIEKIEKSHPDDYDFIKSFL